MRWIKLAMVLLFLCCCFCVGSIISRVSQARLMSMSNPQTWVFPSGHSIETEIKEREDGLINFDIRFRCADGRENGGTLALGYSVEEFEKNFHIKDSPRLFGEIVFYKSGGELFARHMNCP